MISDLIFKICQIPSHRENFEHDVTFPIFNFGILFSCNISRSYFGSILNFSEIFKNSRIQKQSVNNPKYNPILTVARFAIGGVSWCWDWFKIFGIGIFEISWLGRTWLTGMGDFAVDCCEQDCWELKRLCELFCWESVELSWECWDCFFDCWESSRIQLSMSWDNNSSVS